MRGWRFAVAAALFAAPAAAAVTSSSDAGFEVSSSVTVHADSVSAWQALGQPQLWWDGKHSWSGSSANLSLDPHVGGCFCETMPDRGRIEHARVIAILPGKLLRLSGALGPLQEHAAVGTLSFALKPAAGGTTISITYAVAGYMPGGIKALAPAVDAVIADQLAHLAAKLGGAR